MAFGDFDGDELADVLALYASGEARLQRNVGDGTFHDATLDAGLPLDVRSHDAAWVDFDGDGLLDLHLIGSRADQRLYRNQGDGTFADVTAALGLGAVLDERAATWFDYDGDRRLDVLIATSLDERLFHNAGDRGFELVELASLVPVASVVVDAPAVDQPDDSMDSSRQRRARDQASERRVRPTPRGSAGTNAPFSGPLVITPAAPRSGPAGSIVACPLSMRDSSTGTTCIEASTVPALGKLFPLSSTFFVNPSGQVGIGTTNIDPSSKLEVRGQQMLFSTPNGVGWRGFYMQGAAGGVSKLGATSGDGEPRGSLAIQTGDSDRFFIDVLGPLTATSAWGDNKPAMRIEKLDTTAIGSYGSLAFRVANELGHIGSFDTTQIADVLEGGNNRHGLGFWTRQDATSWFERMRISGDGRVGIGTPDPAESLTVNGTIYSEAGGFRFPDNTVQTTAQLIGPKGDKGDTGDQGPPGPAVTTSAVCGANSCNNACNGTIIAQINSPCFVTSDTGDCGATGAGLRCCVCAP